MRNMLATDMQIDEIEAWLRQDDPQRLTELWRAADALRSEYVGDEVHMRGLIEISNHCVRSCAYCGLRAENAGLPRYRMKIEEILDCARQTEEAGFGTVVMQAGEDYGITRSWMTEVIRRIKRETSLAVTLSLGERPREDLEAWREAGAARYLLRFETSDAKLYAKIHPPLEPGEPDRFERIRWLQELGYEAGGGVMIGIPGQSYAALARDIELFREMDLDMIGVGPYVANPDTPLGCGKMDALKLPDGEQVSADETTSCRMIALTRIVRPDANIPATSALAAISTQTGRRHGLERGANVVMPNFTPAKYREMYHLYPGETGRRVFTPPSREDLAEFLASIGRRIGEGHGGRRQVQADVSGCA